MPSQTKDEDFTIESYTYPLAAAIQDDLIGLLRTEWTRTDYDWLAAMQGDYSEKLAITSVIARCDGRPVATATVHFAHHDPEIAVIGNVMTHHQFRARGLAGRLVDVIVGLAASAGCKVCLLGTARPTLNLYTQHGFAQQTGSVMRRPLGSTDFEKHYFASGQPTVIRAADWGDLPGLTLLVAQPLDTVCLDYPRGLFSSRYVPASRCLSNFPVLWYESAARKGRLSMLAEPTSGRIFGFGSVTLSSGPPQQLSVAVDFAVHDNYRSHLSALLAHLLDWCRDQAIQQVQATVASADGPKLSCLRDAGFAKIARLEKALRLNHDSTDVLQLSLSL